MSEIEAAIRDQILTAIGWLGGSPELLNSLRRASKDEFYDAAEKLGADRYLLAHIDSWQVTMDGAEMLGMLREWNAGAQAEALEAVREGHGAMKPPADRVRR